MIYLVRVQRNWKKVGGSITASPTMKILAVTRPRGKGEDTARYIRTLGWNPLIVHTVELRPRNREEVRLEVRTILFNGAPDWLVFMSPFGVQLCFDALRADGGFVPEKLEHSRIVAVGPSTEEAVLNQDVRDVLVPEDYTSEGVAAFLAKSSLEGKRVLMARSSDADDSLARTLTSKGAHVTTIRLYSSAMPHDRSTIKRLVEELRMGSVGGVLFTSSKSASNLFEMVGREGITPGDLAGLLKNSLVGANGPSTARRLRELGVQPDVTPARYLINEAAKLIVDTAKARELLSIARSA